MLDSPNRFLFPGEEVKENEIRQEVSNPFNGESNKQTKVFAPEKYKEAVEIVNSLVDRQSAIINLEGLFIGVNSNEDSRIEARRIVDYVAGACQILKLNMKKINQYTLFVKCE